MLCGILLSGRLCSDVFPVPHLWCMMACLVGNGACAHGLCQHAATRRYTRAHTHSRLLLSFSDGFWKQVHLD